MKDMSSSLHKSDYILATESHRVYKAGYQYYQYLYGQKHKKAQWMHQLYILLKYGGSATKHKLYDQIGAKSSNYCKIDIFNQSENVSVYL